MHLPNLVLHVQSLPPVEPLASFHTNFFHSLVPTLIATSSSHLPRILQIRFVAHPPNPVPLQTSPQQSSRRWLRGSVGQKCGDANMDFGIECTRELRGCVTMVKDQDHAHCPYVKTRLSPAPCFAPSCPSIGLVSHARTFLFHIVPIAFSICAPILISAGCGAERVWFVRLLVTAWAWVIYTVWKMQQTPQVSKLSNLCNVFSACQVKDSWVL